MSEANAASGITTSITAAPPRIATTSRWASPANASTAPHLCDGYWNKPEATEEAFRGGWFHSADLVVMDDEGYIEVVDRIKDVINTGGVLVASREVEDAIYHDARVAEVAVIGTPDDKWIGAVTAVVVLKDGTEATEQEIIDGTRDHL